MTLSAVSRSRTAWLIMTLSLSEWSIILSSVLALAKLKFGLQLHNHFLNEVCKLVLGFTCRERDVA
jgi:hypothetical protein